MQTSFFSDVSYVRRPIRSQTGKTSQLDVLSQLSSTVLTYSSGILFLAGAIGLLANEIFNWIQTANSNLNIYRVIVRRMCVICADYRPDNSGAAALTNQHRVVDRFGRRVTAVTHLLSGAGSLKPSLKPRRHF
jgi:hypothetical protein